MRNARQPFLPDRMMQRADADGLPDDHPLRALAVAVTDALAAPMLDDEGAAERFLHAWHHARCAWVDYLAALPHREVTS